jgi:hypothetical protein
LAVERICAVIKAKFFDLEAIEEKMKEISGSKTRV